MPVPTGSSQIDRPCEELTAQCHSLLILLLHSVPSICPNVYSVRCCTNMINPITDIMRELWEGRLQSTWHTLQSDGFGYGSPFSFRLRFRKCCNPLRWKVAPKTWDLGRTSQDATLQSRTTDRKWPLVLLHVQKCPPLS